MGFPACAKATMPSAGNAAYQQGLQP